MMYASCHSHIFFQALNWSCHCSWKRKAFLLSLCQKGLNETSRRVLAVLILLNFACQLCQKNFTVCCWLENHIREQPGENFACQLCQKNFTVCCWLENHIIEQPGENSDDTPTIKNETICKYRAKYTEPEPWLLFQHLSIPQSLG